jgi:hypothetical protein
MSVGVEFVGVAQDASDELSVDGLEPSSRAELGASVAIRSVSPTRPCECSWMRATASELKLSRSHPGC